MTNHTAPDALADELTSLDRNATPAPWQVVETETATYVAHPRPGNEARLDDVLGGYATAKVNAALIATLRTNLPTILSALRSPESVAAGEGHDRDDWKCLCGSPVNWRYKVCPFCDCERVFGETRPTLEATAAMAVEWPQVHAEEEGGLVREFLEFAEFIKDNPPMQKRTVSTRMILAVAAALQLPAERPGAQGECPHGSTGPCSICGDEG